MSLVRHGSPIPAGTTETTFRSFRIGDYGLIHVGGGPPRHDSLRRALLWEWAASPAGVILRLDTTRPPDDETVRGLVTDCSRLIRAWPGTPIALISRDEQVRDLVVATPGSQLLATAETLPEVWGALWSSGVRATLSVELTPTVQAPATARDIVARACAQWDLEPLAAPAASLTGDLVARSVVQGAQDIHFTVSRHQTRIRVLARDDVPSTAADEPTTIEDVFAVPHAAPSLTGLAGSLGEFALDGHHIRWAVTHDFHMA